MFAVPGWDVRSVDYDVALSMHKAPLSDKVNLRSIAKFYANPSSVFSTNQYLANRGDARVKDWASWVPNATFKTDEEHARALNAIDNHDPRPAPEQLSYLEMQQVTRMILLKVMYENKIDVFVNPEQTTTPYLLGGALEPEVNNRGMQSCCQGFTALLGSPEADVPAGFVTTTLLTGTMGGQATSLRGVFNLDSQFSFEGVATPKQVVAAVDRAQQLTPRSDPLSRG